MGGQGIFEMLLHHKAVEVVQPDATWCGGLTALRRIAAMAREASLVLIPHRGGSLFGLPVVLTSPHCPLAEGFGGGTDLMEAMSARYEAGSYHPSEKHGFGTEITEKLVLSHRL